MESKISVVINTYNAQLYLAQVLESLKEFDEVVVCDMESTDNTVAIAQKYGCRVVVFPKGAHTCCEPARDFAIHSATYDWVFVVDADEIVPTALREYLYRHIQSENPAAGVRIPRKNYFMGRFMHCSYPDYVLRLLKKEGSYWPETIHAVPKVEGRIVDIPSRCKKLAFIHLANEPIRARVDKVNLYTENERVRRRHKRYSFLSLVFKPMFVFVRSYLLKGGFLDGEAGYIYAKNNSLYKYLTLAKLREDRLSAEQTDPEIRKYQL